MKRITLILALLFALPLLAATTYTANISWTASTTAGVKYNVYRESVSGACSATPPTGSTCTLVNAAPLSATSAQDATLTAGNVYFYVVRSVTTQGIESVNSSEGKADLSQPGVPSGVSVSVTVTITTP